MTDKPLADRLRRHFRSQDLLPKAGATVDEAIALAEAHQPQDIDADDRSLIRAAVGILRTERSLAQDFRNQVADMLENLLRRDVWHSLKSHGVC